MSAERLRPILAACATGESPPNVALMRLMIEAASPREIEAALAETRESTEGDESARLDAVCALLRDHPDAFATVKTVMAEARHDESPGSSADAVRGWAGVFDRLAKLSPEGGVALYSLGSPALLAEATDEVVATMGQWHLAQPSHDVLEIGCGSGRFVRALAPLVASITGLDVSAEMIGRARAACAGLANAALRQSSGGDLAGIADASIDVVLAADVFPYLVQAGGDLARRHVEEAARVLRHGGALLVFNYSYRGDLQADRREFSRLLAAEFRLERNGTRDLTLWDAPAFLARRNPCHSGAREARTRNP